MKLSYILHIADKIAFSTEKRDISATALPASLVTKVEVSTCDILPSGKLA
jgi:hypothetical protein